MNTITARDVRPGQIIRWFDGIDTHVTVERVTSDYRQRSIRVHTFHLSNGVTVERGDEDVFYFTPGVNHGD